MRRLAAVLLACSACAHSFVVTNGGVPVPPGACADVVLAKEDLHAVLANAPDCATHPGFVANEGATAAFWQVATTTWAGPVIAPSADIYVEGDRETKLISGERDTGLTSGERDTGLKTAVRDQGLTSGERDKGLTSGERDKGLTSGEHDKGLTSGERDKGEHDKGLTSGERDKGLTSGERDKGERDQAQPVAVLSSGTRDADVLMLLKRVRGGTVDATHSAEVLISAQNVSSAPIAQIYVIDRVSHVLAVQLGDGATSTALADGSTLVAFHDTQPLPPGETRFYSFKVTKKLAGSQHPGP